GNFFMDALNSDAGKTIAQALGHMISGDRRPPQQQQQPQPQRQQIAAPVNWQRPPGARPQASPQMTPRQPVPAADMMAQGMEFLFNQAAANVDPAMVAENFGAMLPEDIEEQLTSVPDPVGWLQERYPRVGQHRAWFQGLVDAFFEPGDQMGPGEDESGEHEQAR